MPFATSPARWRREKAANRSPDGVIELPAITESFNHDGRSLKEPRRLRIDRRDDADGEDHDDLRSEPSRKTLDRMIEGMVLSITMIELPAIEIENRSLSQPACNRPSG
jgi:hypothetical protein